MEEAAALAECRDTAYKFSWPAPRCVVDGLGREPGHALDAWGTIAFDS